MNSSRKAQGALEYLLLIGGSILIAAIVIVVIASIGSTDTASISQQVYDQKYKCLDALADTSLMGYWQFEGNANDCSAQKNNGTISGATIVGGRYGKGLQFRGPGNADYFLTQDSSSLTFGKTMTVAFWTKLNSTVSGGWATGWVEKFGNDSDVSFWVFHSNGNGRVRFVVSPDGLWASRVEVVGTTNLPLNEWHHIAVVANGSSLRIYVDGVLDNAPPFPVFSANIFDSAEGIAMGTHVQDPNFTLNGIIDEVRIYNRALSAAEIAALAS